jgi:N-acetylglucosamine-6-phosphate deacetylase
MRLGVAAALVDGREVAGDVEIREGRVAEVGLEPAGAAGLAVPGFVDLQVNGFAGVDLLTATPERYADLGAGLAAAGVTAFAPTFITAAPDALRRALAAVGPGRDACPVRVLDAHLEGPFLSPAWPGAHPPEHLREPDPALAQELLAAGPVGAVTLAPELPGGLELLEALVARGVGVRIGHTDADAATAHAAFDRGAGAITHIHNGHRRFAARDPGPAGAALARDDVIVTAIVDGVHLAPETVAVVRRAAGARLCLVSDAIAAAGMGDGSFALGGLEVEVSEGRSQRPGGTLAGSVGALDASVRRLVAGGAPLAAAVHAAARAPALLAGRPELGRLAPGAVADVAVLDAELRVVRTLVAGVEVWAGQAPVSRR